MTTRSARRERVRRRRRRQLAIGFAVAAAVFVSVTGIAGWKLNHNITRLNILDQLGDRPSRTSGPAAALNILVMGSDTRQGIGTDEYGTDTVEGGAHSDTNLLVHLSADRSNAYVVSIPRDSMTMAPKDCADPASTVADGEMRQWNYNFNKGGPGCVVKTFEGLTGIFVDHFVVIDFRGFQEMVDGLGGVDVCLPEPIKDADAHLDLPAGKQRLDGKQALGYVRVRKTVGDGSDLGRIKRQQAFMSSMAQEATKTSLLLRPDRLYSFLDAATGSMTADHELGIGAMKDIADSLKGFGVENLRFVTVPTETYPDDPNRVQWKESAETLWTAIRQDQPLPTAKKKPATPDRPLTVSPDQVEVQVVNDTPAAGLDAQEAQALVVQGFQAVAASLPAQETKGVEVRHGAATVEAAKTVAAAFPGARLVVDETLGSVVQVRLGLGAENVAEVPNRLGAEPVPTPSVSAPAAPDEIEERTADTDICA